MPWNNDDYIEVKDRIIKFYADHPNGRIGTEIVELTDIRVTVKAYAYQDPEDKQPTTGHSWLNIPGKTNFTLGSELENAETSAVGRALAMSGYEVKKSIASKDEVAMKQDDSSSKVPPPNTDAAVEQSTPPLVQAAIDAGGRPVPGPRKATAKQLGLIKSKLSASTATTDELLGFISEQFNITSSEQLLMDHIDPLLNWISSFPVRENL